MQNNFSHINRIYMNRLFNYKNVNWSLFDDVNILGGINGSGKSTILKIAYQILNTGYLSEELISTVDSIEIYFTNSVRFLWKKEKVDSLEYVREEGFEYFGNNKIGDDGKIIIQKIRIEDDNNVTYLFNEVRNNLNIYFINSYEQTLLKNEELSAIAENLRTYLDVLIFKQIYQRNSKLVNVYEQVKESVDQIDMNNIQEQVKKNVMDDNEIKLLISSLMKKKENKEIDDEDIIKTFDIDQDGIFKNKLGYYIEKALTDLVAQKSKKLLLAESQLWDIYEIMEQFYNSSLTVEKNPLFTFKCKDNSIIDFTHLSTGEKQLLLILLMVFNTEKKECVFFMDEPDLSMHVDWKEKFVTTLRKINPNMQLIIATHAPSLIEGWFDKVKEVCEISQDID
mgnify:FL=1|jgi:energy-coupling factor transporter ATP-binding protein EcfA2|nr:AAA family ATPase [Bacteroides intestinalis]